FTWQTIVFGLFLSGMIPWTMAIIGSWQGWNALIGHRFKPSFKAMLLHSMLLMVINIGLTYPIAFLVLPIFIIWGQKKADDVWLISGLSPRMKQEWNRLQRSGISTGVRSLAPEEE
ncbi:MAG: hypothetical protein VYC11_04085, partial [Candidatus Thermoplasmatota archaeon]|nr:hypothetical protein [Candidatus Thermoplasmatota archaeon]